MTILALFIASILNSVLRPKIRLTVSGSLIASGGMAYLLTVPGLSKVSKVASQCKGDNAPLILRLCTILLLPLLLV